jgi:hypothetical protein
MSQDREWPALVKEILRTAAFRRAPLRAELLRYFFANVHKPHGISRKTLAAEVFKSARYDEGAVGERCLDLRNALREYAESGTGQVQTWRCELPPAVPSEGYRLRFVNQVAAPGATGVFWQAHLSPPRDVLIVYNEPLFYRDEAEHTVVRYLDINHDQTQTDRERALSELKAKRPKAPKEKLHPSYLYLLSGEVAARDCIVQWFDTVAGVRAKGRIGRRVTSPEIAQSSPVLLGNLRTNSFMRNILESASCEHLDYRLDPEGFGTIAIRNPGEQEKEALQKQGEGRKSGGETRGGGLLLKGATEANRDVFGVVTRIPNPYDNEGAVTIISSDHTRAVEQIAHLLTDEHRFSSAIAQAGWPADEPPPACFQCLFAVRLGPVNMDTEAKPAVLIATRSYSG